ncbi:MAG: 3-deoxy-D-manno-octulosonic acid transferase, partial [Pseudomonadota bacterium]
AASTRDGEEELILDAISALNLPELLTIMVPRHPQRFDQVAKLIEQRGLAYQKRSDNLVISADTKVVLGDSMSEMFAYYAACDLAFIGGSLLPFGGQNLIEASSVGRPVLIGPHTYNFEQATELAIAAGAALRVENATELQQKICELFAQPQRLAEMGNAGLLFVKSNTGATEKALNLVQQNLVQG